MKFSELLKEYVDLKVSGEPERSDWISIVDAAAKRREYYNRLEELEAEMDATIANGEGRQS